MTLEVFQGWVIQTGLVISLLIAIILLIRRPFARAFGANAAYALWSLPLIRLCLPGLSVPQDWVPSFLRQVPKDPVPMPAFEIPESGSPAFTGGPKSVAPTEMTTFDVVQWGVILVAVWLCVAILWLGYQLMQQSRFKSNLITTGSKPSLNLQKEIQRAADKVGLRKVPLVLMASDAAGPLVTGVRNPLVILPNKFYQTFDAQQRQFALVHEFAHIKRRDLWVALAALIFRAANWPNPLVHYASHKLRGDQEAACDAFVVKVTGGETAHSYAETLVKAVREDSRTSRPKAHLALSLIEGEPENSKGD